MPAFRLPLNSTLRLLPYAQADYSAMLRSHCGPAGYSARSLLPLTTPPTRMLGSSLPWTFRYLYGCLVSYDTPTLRDQRGLADGRLMHATFSLLFRMWTLGCSYRMAFVTRRALYHSGFALLPFSFWHRSPDPPPFGSPTGYTMRTRHYTRARYTDVYRAPYFYDALRLPHRTVFVHRRYRTRTFATPHVGWRCGLPCVPFYTLRDCSGCLFSNYLPRTSLPTLPLPGRPTHSISRFRPTLYIPAHTAHLRCRCVYLRTGTALPYTPRLLLVGAVVMIRIVPYYPDYPVNGDVCHPTPRDTRSPDSPTRCS